MTMELTGKLKEEVEKAETKEEKKSLIEDAGMELTDEEMDKVSGGMPTGGPKLGPNGNGQSSLIKW